MNDTLVIYRLDAECFDNALPALTNILIDCVEGGASVGFMQPMTLEKARSFWNAVAHDVRDGSRIVFVAEDSDKGIIGTVQLVNASPENQPHRADVAKMLVHGSARRRGVALRLMQALENEAKRIGRTVLVLDTVTGSAAERVYVRAGWQRVGTVPDFALMPDGPRCSTTFFCKSLE